MVFAAQRAIREGEVFQVNLSHRLEADVGDADPLALYARLSAANPAPYRAFFASGPVEGGAFFVLSSSPELLFELAADGTLRAKPIAGTRPRSGDAAEDARLAAELRRDGKEQAEHVMLVDLARNDLGRVAAFGSVRVPRLAEVESYRTVHHLVSTVEARLAPGQDLVDVLRALFPGGTITGAPKVRAMELIERIEPVRRGVSTGSLVHVRPDGSAVANILIRTMFLRGGKLHVQVGAGIVEESVAEREWAETMAKAEGMLRALRGEMRDG
jgi:anthranilate/para-aminobenzoate synthase component I